MKDADEVLAHFGIKGQKWGVRRNKPSGPESVSVTVTPGKKLKTSGGGRHGAAPDAVAAASIHQKAKKSSTDSLSNAELKSLVERMNLERQYSSLNYQNQSAGKKFISSLLGDFGNSNAKKLSNDASAEQVKKAMQVKTAKTVAKAAVKVAGG